MFTLIRLNSPEWKLILVGVLASVINGSSLPIFAILFGEFYGVSYSHFVSIIFSLLFFFIFCILI